MLTHYHFYYPLLFRCDVKLAGITITIKKTKKSNIYDIKHIIYTLCFNTVYV